MYSYICYLKKSEGNAHITQMLSNIFKCDEEYISDLLNPENFEIRFENRILDNVSEFYVELNVYLNDDNNITTVFGCNFLFGIEVSKYLNEEVLVSSRNDDSYEWILIGDSSFFIAEEKDNDVPGITLLRSNNSEISYNKAMLISS